MKAKIKGFHSPDIDNLYKHSPKVKDYFCFLLQVMIGPLDQAGEESFDFMVCTPRWIEQQKDAISIGRHCLIVKYYDFEVIEKKLIEIVSQCKGNDWNDIGSKLSRFGRWEFEDYSQSTA